MGLYKDPDIVAGIKKKTLEWIGHVVRMDQGRTVNKNIWEETGGKYKKGKTKIEMAGRSAGDKG